ncbi:MAG: type 4a pilus biogenesis protein PilO [Candidatus Acidiferrales bacterium]
MASFRELPPLMNILLAVLLAVLVVGAGLYVPGSPLQSQRTEIAAADKQIDELTSQVRLLEDYERRHADLKAQVAGLEKQLEVLRTIVPEEKDVDEFIRMMHASAASSNVEIRRITSKPVVAREFHNELPFEIEFDGPYYSVMSFFAKLGRLSRIINVGDLHFSGADAGKQTKYPMRPGTTVVATTTATTFFTKTEAPAEPAGKQPGKTPGRPAPPAKR